MIRPQVRVLEFTVIVVIIFAAVILGVLGLLGDQQIGTLFATIKAGLKEIIFATTCPSDTKATDAAIEVERELRAEGHDLKVVVYSWSDLELMIAQHSTAYNYFFPSAVA